MPLVSVVIPTHNRPDMPAEALVSVRAQTFIDYEIIVVSNGEPPAMQARSRTVAESFGARWLWLHDGNLSAARNHGILLAKGEWIAFLDDDDLWLPEKLEYQVEAAYETGADMIACDYVEFDAYGKLPDRVVCPGPADVKKISHQLWWAAPSAVIVRADALRDIGFDPSFTCCDDTELWRRIAWRHRILQVDAILMKRRRAHQSLARARFKALWSQVRLFRKSWRDTPADLRWALPGARTMMWRIADSSMRIYVRDVWTGNATLRAIDRRRWIKWLRQPFHPAGLKRRWQAAATLFQSSVARYFTGSRAVAKKRQSA
jgi:glycosyltransferase involved in cell wall biosynthesis